jgi:hypothetical protein
VFSKQAELLSHYDWRAVRERDESHTQHGANCSRFQNWRFMIHVQLLADL